MLFLHNRPVRCFSCAWEASDFTGRDVHVGQPASQTYFEILALLLAVELWCGTGEPTVILGDNTAALQEALDLKGRGPQGDLAQAKAILRCARSLNLAVAHLPSEANLAADALSRQADRPKPEWPFSEDQCVVRDAPLALSSIWEWIR